MPIVISPESELGRELCKHEQHFTKYVGDGMTPGNPYVYRPFPAMLYKASKKRNGQACCIDIPPDASQFENMAQYERACLDVEAFNRRNQRIVGSEEEHRRAMNEGWSKGPNEALEKFEAIEKEIGQAAAEAAYRAQHMSEKARAEFKAAESATEHHVTDVMGVPKARRGRPKKIKVVAGLEGDVEES